MNRSLPLLLLGFLLQASPGAGERMAPPGPDPEVDLRLSMTAAPDPAPVGSDVTSR